MSGTGRTTGSGQTGNTGLETCPRCGAVYALPMEQCPGCGLALPERAARMGPGTILDGKYQIVSLLGSGGMGEVFKVRHIQLNAVRTIKVLRSNLLADEWYRNRFLREARLATQVHHSNVAVVHDFATLPNGSYYMVSEFIDGLTVRQWLKRYGPFPLGLAVEVVSQVLSGLGHCHRRGLLHRDISPDNIMISIDAEDHPVAKIIDLGIAKQVAGNAADATQTGLFMGNPRYCSPEQLGQLKEGEELDLRTDLYSMGMVLYEMVTGSGPFQSTTPHGFFVKHLTQTPPHLKEVKPDVSWPEGFDAALLKALEKDRNRRYKTAFEFADALKPFAVDLSRGLAETFGLKLDRPERDTDRTDRIATAGFSQVASAKKQTDATLTYESKTEFEKKAAEEREWVRAQADGSEEAWRGFLDKYPDSPRREEGLRALSEARAFKEAAKANSRDAWEGFVASWPQSRFRDEARRRAEQAKERENDAFELAGSTGTADAYREFLGSYPASPLAPKARALLEEQVGFDAALQKDTEAAWEVFLKLWPAGRNASAAVERRQAARRREEQDLAVATREGTSAALRRFLEKHPEGKSRPLAQERLQEATDFEAAVADGSEKSWRGFLDRYPKSARREEAGQMLAEAQAFQKAGAADTREAWETYLASWPDSRRRDEAQKRVEQAKRKEAEALERAKAKGSSDAYREFVAAYPRSPLAAQARSLLEEQLAFQAATERNTEGAWGEFLDRWPSGRNAPAAVKRRDEASRKEEEALTAAIREGTSRALRGFLEKNPDAKARPRAEELLREATDYESAGTRGKAGWEGFLQKHPKGAHAEGARQKLQQIETEALLAEIQEHERGERQPELERLVKAHSRSSPVGTAAREALSRVEKALDRRRREEEEARKKALEARAKAKAEAEKAAAIRDVAPAEVKTTIIPRSSGVEPTAKIPPAIPRPAPAAEKTVRMPPTPAEKPRVEAILAPPEEPRRISPKTILIAAAILVALGAGALLLTRRGGAAQEEPAPGESPKAVAAAPNPPEASTASAPAPAPPGLLVVDALPWGQIDRVEDAAGKNWANGPALYTPLSFSVPPGRYSISVTSPNFAGKSLALTAEVRPGETSRVLGRFAPVDPKTYFEAQGWKP